VERRVLIEPGPVNDSARDHRPTRFVGLDVFESLFWDNEIMTAQDHARADYRLLGVTMPAASKPSGHACC
jgi:hypothetical protein